MHRSLVASLLAALALACGPSDEACMAYVDTYERCVAEAEAAGLPVDVDTSDPEGFCEQMDFTDEQWACNEAAYASGDCSTEEGLAAILVEVDAC